VSPSIQTNNPFDAPLIDPAYFESPFDLFVAREAIKGFRRFLSAPAWHDVLVGPAGALATATTDALLDEFIIGSTGSGAHPVGTAAMARRGAPWGVVEPDLRLKGAAGVRVVDASVMVSLALSVLFVWEGVAYVVWAAVRAVCAYAGGGVYYCGTRC
jgi:choline dehydrogenase-like flavoprotein